MDYWIQTKNATTEGVWRKCQCRNRLLKGKLKVKSYFVYQKHFSSIHIFTYTKINCDLKTWLHNVLMNEYVRLPTAFIVSTEALQRSPFVYLKELLPVNSQVNGNALKADPSFVCWRIHVFNKFGCQDIYCNSVLKRCSTSFHCYDRE